MGDQPRVDHAPVALADEVVLEEAGVLVEPRFDASLLLLASRGWQARGQLLWGRHGCGGRDLVFEATPARPGDGRGRPLLARRDRRRGRRRRCRRCRSGRRGRMRRPSRGGQLGAWRCGPIFQISRVTDRARRGGSRLDEEVGRGRNMSLIRSVICQVGRPAARTPLIHTIGREEGRPPARPRSLANRPLIRPGRIK